MFPTSKAHQQTKALLLGRGCVKPYLKKSPSKIWKHQVSRRHQCELASSVAIWLDQTMTLSVKNPPNRSKYLFALIRMEIERAIQMVTQTAILSPPQPLHSHLPEASFIQRSNPPQSLLLQRPNSPALLFQDQTRWQRPRRIIKGHVPLLFLQIRQQEMYRHAGWS